MDNLEDLKEYFQNTIAANHTDIDHFIYGNFDALIEYISDIPEDSILFMEWPEAFVADNSGSYQQEYETGLYLLRKINPEDYVEQNTALSNMLKIITDHLLPRIRKDAFDNDDFFSISQTRSIEPVTFMTMNGLVGYRFTIRYGVWLDVEAENESVWLDKP